MNTYGKPAGAVVYFDVYAVKANNSSMQMLRLKTQPVSFSAGVTNPTLSLYNAYTFTDVKSIEISIYGYFNSSPGNYKIRATAGGQSWDSAASTNASFYNVATVPVVQNISIANSTISMSIMSA